MPANITPVYSKLSRVSAGGTTLTFRYSTSTATASTTYDATGTLDTSVWEAFKADATNGSFLRSIVCKIVNQTAGVAAVVRFFINNGSTNATNTNNGLYKELTLPAITAGGTASTPDFEIPCNIMLGPSYRILYQFGSTAPGNAWMIYGVGGDY